MSSLARIRIRIELNASCAAGDTDVLTALSGIAVAFFTFILWRSTHLLWKTADAQQRSDADARQADLAHLEESLAVARQNAEAAVTQSRIAERGFLEVERPYVRVASIGGVFQAQTGGVGQYGGSPPDTGHVACYVYFRIQNVGRAPATIHQVKFKMLYSVGFPENPDYDMPNMIPIEFNLSSNGITENAFITDAVDNVEIFKAAIVEPNYVFFYGIIIYSDMAGDIFFKKTAFRLISPKRFLRVTGIEHNEEKRFDKPEEFVWLD